MKQEKLISQKLYKNPDSFLYDESFFSYIRDLQDRGLLNTLPQNLYVYYVLTTLTREVYNGGFSLYLTNSSRHTFSELSNCAKLLNHSTLTPLILDFVNLVTEYLQANKMDVDSADYDESIENVLSEYDEKYCFLDQKLLFDKAILQYYKTNYSIPKIYISKEKPSETCAYYSFAEKYSISDTINCFLNFLTEYNISWDILINDLHLIAIPETDCIDLCEIMEHFSDDKYSFSIHGFSNDYHSRKGLCSFGFTKIVAPVPKERCCNGYNELNAIEIKKSEFEDNEYKMKCGYELRWIEGSPISPHMLTTYIMVACFSEHGIGISSKNMVLDELLLQIKNYKSINSLFEKLYSNNFSKITNKYYYKKAF